MRAFRFALIVLLALIFDSAASSVMGPVDAVDMQKPARRPSIRTAIRTLHEVTARKTEGPLSVSGINSFRHVRKPARRFNSNPPVRKLPPRVTDDADSPSAHQVNA
jgi:hypothetical protein